MLAGVPQQLSCLFMISQYRLLALAATRAGRKFRSRRPCSSHQHRRCSGACLAHGFGDGIAVAEPSSVAVAGSAVGAHGGLGGGLADAVLARALVRAVVVEMRQAQLCVCQLRPPA